MGIKFTLNLALVMICVISFMLSSAPLQVDTENATIKLNGKNFVPISIFVQPSRNFSYWSDLGVNTVIGAELNILDWMNKLAPNNLYGIPTRHQTSLNNDRIIAYWLGDEPDIAEKDANGNWVIPRTDTTEVKQWSESLRSARPNHPQMLNFSGGSILNQMITIGIDRYKSWSRNVEMISQDRYPISSDQDPGLIPQIGILSIKLMSFVDEKKPVGAFIEACNYKVGRDPTPGEFQAEVWVAIGKGARFISYFGVIIEPSFGYNCLTGNTALENEIRTTNALIKQMTDVIMAPHIKISGVRKGFTSAPVKLDLGYRKLNSDLYIFAISSMAKVATFTLEIDNGSSSPIAVMGENRNATYIDGKINDTFTTSNTAHIYKLKDYFIHNPVAIYTGSFVGNNSVLRMGSNISADQTKLKFRITQPQHVQLHLFKNTGEKINTPLNKYLLKGNYTFNISPWISSTGVYFAQLVLTNVTHTLPVVVLTLY